MTTYALRDRLRSLLVAEHMLGYARGRERQDLGEYIEAVRRERDAFDEEIEAIERKLGQRLEEWRHVS